MTAFKAAYVRFRRRPDQPDRWDDLSEMIDFGGQIGDPRIMRMPSLSQEDVYQGPIFGLRDFPGFLYAPQALSINLQHFLSYRALSVYCETPHTTNIDLIPPKSHEIVNNIENNESQWDLWKNTVRIEDSKEKLKTSRSTTRTFYRNYDKLSWATLGHHYDWTSRTYPLEMSSPMAPELTDLSTFFARTAFQYSAAGISTSFSFAATASIVNFYNEKSNMGCHRDDGELAVDKPIVSVSMGRPAVFLLGGATKDDVPVPILVRAGDVMILGGASRLNYHSMARLLPYEGLPPVAESACPQEPVGLSGLQLVPPEDMIFVNEFLSSHRINVNVRQVFPDSQVRDD
ncbi:alkylated DNA repair protein alkB homolog 1 [Fistulifera solaris]|uniref:Alkylated DNA repair protein alkB homolog 1 n=1 Tax=Fistulifera solaris TaxID=1519565 RepID=A0A1Z5KGE9_FISSO|nr:alkylated DNA repair protein alkB homolog 1 [Fistulifera solaris]|eukprot:GAX25048.1 alkylated DNA repair protein alkB homolog 1 [Fistulifera solaris]